VLRTLPIDQPWRNAEADVEEGYDYIVSLLAYQQKDTPWRIQLGAIRKTKTWWSLDKVAAYANEPDLLSPVKAGSLKQASKKRILQWAELLRPAGNYFVDEGDVPFAARVADILKHGFSALVIADSQRHDLHTLVDGYGRYHLAVVLGVDRLPVILLRDKILDTDRVPLHSGDT
jgi:hypothetical protein